MIEIKHKHSGSVLFGVEVNSIKAALEIAVEQGADLRGAGLRGADLSGAGLSGAGLSGADLSGAEYGDGVPISIEPIQILGIHWPVYIFDHHIKIGCELHSIDEWDNYSDEEISTMDDFALEFWRDWKDCIIDMARKHEPVDEKQEVKA